MIIPSNDRARLDAPVDHHACVGSDIVADDCTAGDRRATPDHSVVAYHAAAELHAVVDGVPDDDCRWLACDRRVRSDSRVAGDDRVADHGPGTDHGVGEDHGVLDNCIRLNRRVAPDRGTPQS